MGNTTHKSLTTHENQQVKISDSTGPPKQPYDQPSHQGRLGHPLGKINMCTENHVAALQIRKTDSWITSCRIHLAEVERGTGCPWQKCSGLTSRDSGCLKEACSGWEIELKSMDHRQWREISSGCCGAGHREGRTMSQLRWMKGPTWEEKRPQDNLGFVYHKKGYFTD